MPVPNAASTAPSPETPVVMIVDDDFSARLQVRFTLENAGFEVMEAASGQEALDLWSTRQPDLILLDVIMPDMDGFATCRALRTLPGAAHLPVVMVTGLEDTETIIQSFNAGATDFIIKPINMLILGYRARFWLRSGSIMRELAISQGQDLKV